MRRLLTPSYFKIDQDQIGKTFSVADRVGQLIGDLLSGLDNKEVWKQDLGIYYERLILRHFALLSSNYKFLFRTKRGLSIAGAHYKKSEGDGSCEYFYSPTNRQRR